MSSTPVRVPSSAANHTPATLDPDLRSQINAVLIRDGHVTRIQDHLLNALNAHESNWPTAIQHHALALLRSGEINTLPALMRRVLEDIRQDTALGASARAGGGGAAAKTEGKSGGGIVKSEGRSSGGGGKGDGRSGGGGASAPKAGPKAGSKGSGEGAGAASLAIPPGIVEEAVRITRESLEAVCDATGPRAD